MKTVVNRPITPKISKITNQYKNIFVIKFVSNTIKIAKTALVEICVKKNPNFGNFCYSSRDNVTRCQFTVYTFR